MEKEDTFRVSTTKVNSFVSSGFHRKLGKVLITNMSSEPIYINTAPSSASFQVSPLRRGRIDQSQSKQSMAKSYFLNSRLSQESSEYRNRRIFTQKRHNRKNLAKGSFSQPASRRINMRSGDIGDEDIEKKPVDFIRTRKYFIFLILDWVTQKL